MWKLIKPNHRNMRVWQFLVLVAVLSGALLVRHGLRLMPAARGIGLFFACAGFVLAGVPLIALGLVLWLLSGP